MGKRKTCCGYHNGGGDPSECCFPIEPAITGENSCHDHGNCELCDHIDGQLAALRARVAELEAERDQLLAKMREQLNEGVEAVHDLSIRCDRLAEALRQIAHDGCEDLRETPTTGPTRVGPCTLCDACIAAAALAKEGL